MSYIFNIILLSVFTVGVYASSFDDNGNYNPNNYTGNKTKYSGHGYTWENSNLGLNNLVPSAWSPIKINNNSFTTIGREFLFKKNILPAQIYSQRKPLFASTPKLNLTIDGFPLKSSPNHYRIISKSDHQVILEKKIKQKNVDIQITAILEYDGFLRFDLNIVPTKKITINNFSLELPIDEKIAKYFSRYPEFDQKKKIINPKDLPLASGLIDKKLSFEFNPAIWIGNKQVGIEWISETNIDYHLILDSATHVITPHDKHVMFKTNLINKNIIINRPLTYSFALLATPNKNKRKDWRQYYLTPSWLPKKAIKKSINVKGKMLYFGNYSIVPLEFPGLPEPKKTSIVSYKSTRKILKKAGIKYIPYSSLNALPANLPEFKHYLELWRAKPAKKGTIHWRKKVKLKKSIQPVYYDKKSIRDFLIYSHYKTIENHDIDGIYFDLTNIDELSNLVISTNNNVTRKQFKYFPMYSQRELLKRYWNMSKAKNKKFTVIFHGTHLPHFIGAFSDIIVSGESLHRLFRTKNTMVKITKTPQGKSRYLFSKPEEYIPDYYNLPNSVISNTLFQNDSYTNMLLPQVAKFNEPFLKENQKKYQFWSRTILSKVLINDLLLWRTRIHTPTLESVYNKFINFGGIEEQTIFLSAHQIENLNLQISPSNEIAIYQNQSKFLIILSNTHHEKRKFRLKLSPEIKAQVKLLKITDAETLKNLTIQNNHIEIDVDGHNFKMIVIQ